MPSNPRARGWPAPSNTARAEFQRNADRIADDIARRLRQPVYGLRGAAGVYAVNGKLDRASFGAYVASRNLPRDFPGVRGLGFIQRVERSDESVFLAEARADGAPQFALRQLQDKHHDDLYVIQYIEPVAPKTIPPLPKRKCAKCAKSSSPIRSSRTIRLRSISLLLAFFLLPDANAANLQSASARDRLQ